LPADPVSFPLFHGILFSSGGVRSCMAVLLGSVKHEPPNSVLKSGGLSSESGLCALPGGRPPVANDQLRMFFDLGQQERRGALLPSGTRIVLRREGHAIEWLSVVAREVARC
jgi:hypothetical protein